MRIEFKMEGGLAHFPGLARPMCIDSEQLSQEELAELEGLVEKVRFFELPSSSPPPAKGAADYYTYTVTLEAGGRRKTVRLTDPIEDPNLQRLITALRAKARALLSA